MKSPSDSSATTPRKSSFSGRPGFALIVTLMMMVLLVILSLGMLSLSSVSLRAGVLDEAGARARANARMAMMIALGKLQELAGPDQRATGTAALLKGSSPTTIENPAWTGVWDVTGQQGVQWLVSGESPDPNTELPAEARAVSLVSADGSGAQTKPVRAQWVEATGGEGSGRYAYWVGDEGVKARVDLARPPLTTSNDALRVLRSQAPQEPSLTALDDEIWAGFEPGGVVRKDVLPSMGTVSLATSETPDLSREELPGFYFHDLTTGGYGIPTDVAKGGLKADLSLVFDRSQQNQPFVKNFIGATPAPRAGSTVTPPQVDFTSISKKFYLSPTLRNAPTSPATGTGPNWGNLLNYARQWETVSSNETQLVQASPMTGADAPQADWNPYENKPNSNIYKYDQQHTNSSVGPVISLLQVGIYFDVKLKAGTQDYEPYLLVRPVVGLWNPYNVAITPRNYQIKWGLRPYLHFIYQTPTEEKHTEIWMRKKWLQDSDAGTFLSMFTNVPYGFQPGEFRLFSVGADRNLTARNPLESTLVPEGAFRIHILGTSTNKGTIPEGTTAWFEDIFLQDTQWDGVTATYGAGARVNINRPKGATTAVTWASLESESGGSGPVLLQRFADLWNGGNDETGAQPYIPEPIRNLGNNPRFQVNGSLVGQPHHLGTWRFYLRTPTDGQEPQQGLRGWVDSNPRALAGNPRFDGSKSPGPSGKMEGWNMISHLMAGSHDLGSSYGDGHGGDRGLVAVGNQAPENIHPWNPPTPDGRWQGFTGISLSPVGDTHHIIYDVPRVPLTSVGQFQHAQLSRYNHEPGFVVGNSYANPRIPLDSTVANLGFPIVDISHEVNESLWDGVFFSTLGLDYLGVSTGPFENSAFNFSALSRGDTLLPNPRMVFSPLPGDSSIDTIISEAGDLAPQAMAARIKVAGAFNVNSTSKDAWKAVLASMGASELPVIDPLQPASAVSWEDPDGIRFNRFGRTILDEGFGEDDDESSRAFSRGWRELSADELEKLAGAIVDEVVARGPFMSLADFVNRDPDSDVADQQRKGALQAALDKVVNNAIPGTMALQASKPPGAGFSDAIQNENQAAGHAGYLLQGDVLQSLGPLLQVRSDYFRIRTCGQALDESGKVVSTAWCEAFVQRTSEFVEAGSDRPEVQVDDITSDVNRRFGRRFEIVSFRWLSASEI